MNGVSNIYPSSNMKRIKRYTLLCDECSMLMDSYWSYRKTCSKRCREKRFKRNKKIRVLEQMGYTL